MSDIQDTLLFGREDLTLFTPHYSNLKAAEIIDLIDSHVSLKDRKFKTKKEELFEVVIYNCLVTVFSIKLSDSDLERLEKHPDTRSKEYHVCGTWKHIPHEYFNKFILSVLLLYKICKLNKKNLAIIIPIILRFLNINHVRTWGKFNDNYFLNHHNYTFETYEESLRAFRTFLVWFDIELSQTILKSKSKGLEEFLEIQQFIKTMLGILPGVINLDEQKLPENYIELIQMYNPEFGNLLTSES